jgi:lipopolysaccharide export LptBFGC system permease protein LptF
MRSTKATTAVGKYAMPVFIVFLLLVNVSNIFGDLMVDSKIGLSMFALSSYSLFAALAFWLDRKRS